jgi:hypothetical protein
LVYSYLFIDLSFIVNIFQEMYSFKWKILKLILIHEEIENYEKIDSIDRFIYFFNGNHLFGDPMILKTRAILRE